MGKRIATSKKVLVVSVEATASAKLITDLPLDMLMLIFGHLPLSEVLKHIALVNRSFYRAHIAFCRNYVKHLTINGQYLSKDYQSANLPIRLRTKDEINLHLFKFARLQPSLDASSVNPVSNHLYLSATSEGAFMAICSKFFSVTHLELFEVALERDYRGIVKMLSTHLAKLLVELKIFVSRERYDANGNRVSLRNNSPAVDRILEVLKPTVAPAFRSLVLVQGCEGEEERMHDSYRGVPRLQFDLSKLEMLTLGPSYSTILARHLIRPENFPSLKQLTLTLGQIDDPLVNHLNLQGTLQGSNSKPPNIFSQLTHLTVNGFFYGNIRVCRFIIEQCARGRALKYFSLPSCRFMTIKFALTAIAPLAASLEHLRLSAPDQTADNWDLNSDEERNFQPGLQALGHIFVPVFTKVTTLHLSNTPLLHSLEKGLPVLMKYFPNVERLILSGNFTHSPKQWVNRKYALEPVHHARAGVYFQKGTFAYDPVCDPCAQFIGGCEAEKLQQKVSTTADLCKEKLVLAALKSWPKLKSIDLSIEDFLGGKDLQPEWTFLHLYETLDCSAIAAKVAATPSTGDSTANVPILDQQWKVKKVAF